MIQIMWGLSDFSDESWLQNVKVLPGGCNLVVRFEGEEVARRIGEIKIDTYWDIDTSSPKDEGAARRAVAFHRNAVQIRTRSDVPIGILLSGGLDSSSLVAAVSEYYSSQGRDPADIHTFTSCYDGFKEGDEREFARMVNDYCGTTQHFIYPDERDTLSAWEKMIWHQEGGAPLKALGGFLTLREIAKTGLKVMLNGQGSDEAMFGYERYYAWYLRDVLRRDGVKVFVQELHAAAKNSRMSHRELLAYMTYFLNFRLRKWRNRKRMESYASSFILNLFEMEEKIRRYVSFDDMVALQYNELRGTQLTHILRMDDRSYMAFSMESRVPFIDYRYIEETMRIPEREKIANGFTKYPLRKYVEGHLPESVVWRKNKMGWPSPRKRWIDRFDKIRINEMLREPRSEKYFDVFAVRKLWKTNPYGHAVEQFLNTEILMRLFEARVS